MVIAVVVVDGIEVTTDDAKQLCLNVALVACPDIPSIYWHGC